SRPAAATANNPAAIAATALRRVIRAQNRQPMRTFLPRLPTRASAPTGRLLPKPSRSGCGSPLVWRCSAGEDDELGGAPGFAAEPGVGHDQRRAGHPEFADAIERPLREPG